MEVIVMITNFKKTALMLILLTLSLGILNAMIEVKGIIADNNTVSVNGVKLEYENSTIIESEFTGQKFTFDGSSGDVKLSGVKEKRCKLIINYFEYEKDDATIYINIDKLAYKTKSGKPVFISSLTGSLPENTDLAIDISSGDIDLDSFNNLEQLYLNSGSGNIKLANIDEIMQIIADTGSGRIRVRDIYNANMVDFNTGSGDIFMENCSNIFKMVGDTGSGNIKMNKIVCSDVQLDTGSGDIYLLESIVQNLEADTGAGNVILKGTNIKKQNISTGSGEVFYNDNSK